MSTYPGNVVVVGTGGGGATIAAELALGGASVTVADLPAFADNLAAIQNRGGIEAEIRRTGDVEPGPVVLAPIPTTSDDPAAAIAGAPLVIISVPSFGHRPLAEVLASSFEDEQVVLWVGEGGGAFAAVAVLRELGLRPRVLLGETNTLPYAPARIVEPGKVVATHKSGGTLIAALPAGRTADVHTVAASVWPWITAAENAWETVLVNFNAIDHVATMICNLGVVEGPPRTMKLWGDGATPGVARVIGAVDAEYLALRMALGLADATGYEQYLVEQGLAPERGADLHATMHSSGLAFSEFSCGPGALDHRYITEDVPYSLVLASSIGREVGVKTPVIDGLIAIASAASGRDFRDEGRTLNDWGLEGAGAVGLRRAAEEGWW